MIDHARPPRPWPSRTLLIRFARPISVALAVGLALTTVGPSAADATTPTWAPVAPAVPVPSAPSLPVVAPITTGLDSFDSQVLMSLNGQRAAAGLGALIEVKGIDAQSMKWSQSMAGTGILAHDPQAFTLLLTSGAPDRTTFGENVASWTDSSVNGSDLVTKYATSQTNTANILNSAFKYVGIATATAVDGSKWSTTTFVDSADRTQTYDPALKSIPIGQFNSATMIGSTVQVAGWGYDLDDAVSPIQVQLTDTAPNGDVTSSTVTADTVRTDVTQLSSTTGTAHGFAATLPIAGRGPHKICATLLNAGAGSTDPALGCLGVEVTGPLGSLDTADVSGTTATVTGWTVDPDVPTSATTVTLSDQNAQGVVAKQTVTANQADVNVATAIPGVGANHGFSAQISVTTPGTHTLCATANSVAAPALTKDLGCKSVTVTMPPVARFTTSVAALKVSVDGTASTDAQGPIASYAWKFGDGAYGTGATATHTYAAAGTYSITLTATDSLGLTNTVAQAVTINSPPIAIFTPTTSNLTVAVDGSASTDAQGPISSYAWNYGDGGTGSGVKSTHAYAAAGSYVISLTVTDSAGLTATGIRSVVTTLPPAVVYVKDTFSRTLVNGLGTADVGGAWRLNGSAALFAINGASGRIKLATPGSGPSAFLGGVSARNVDATVDVSIDKAATGGGFYFSLAARHAGANDYRLKIRTLSNGSVTMFLTKVLNNTETTLVSGPVAGLNAKLGGVLRLRLQVSGTTTATLNGKVWKVGSAEPAAFQQRATDSSGALQAPGGVGVLPYLSGSATNAPVVASIDNLTATEIR